MPETTRARREVLASRAKHEDGPMNDNELRGLRCGGRGGHYREFATEAMLKAREAADPRQRAQYLSIAAKWHALAVEADELGDGSRGPGG